MRLFQVILLGFFLSAPVCGAFMYQGYKEELHSPCLPPLRYSIGEVNPQFGVSRAQYTVLAHQAEYIWEQALGADVLAYDPSAAFTISLVFDERQSKTNTGKQLESNIATEKSSYEDLTRELEGLNTSHDALLADYRAFETKYTKELTAYKKDVAYWNNRGGAPKDEYETLQDKQEDLKSMADELNKKAAAVNALAKDSHKIVQEINSTASVINSNIDTYNTLFGEEREFDKGIYTRNAITVYQMEKITDLRLTLVHEFGHALGIEQHVDDPQAIMYYLLRDQNVSPITLTEADIAAVNAACHFDTDPTPMDFFNRKAFLGTLHELWPQIFDEWQISS